MSHRLALLLLTAMALPALLHAKVTPLEEREKPHSLWEYRTAPAWNGRSLDDFENRRVNSDQSGQIQNEQMAFINPLVPENMVTVWRDFRFGYRRIGYAYTNDGGETWTDSLFPQMYYSWQSDPVLVVDDNGVFTANVISYEQDQEHNGLLQVSSNDGGITWQDSVWASHITDGSAFEDKQMLCIDTCIASPYYGTFYCTWTRFPTSGGTVINLVLKRPGEPYTPPIPVSQETGVQWSNVTTGVNGEVYVSWLGYQQGGIMFARSLDGGETFTPEELIRPTNFRGANIVPDLLIFAYGAMAVDRTDGPHRNRLYMVFTNSDQDDEQTDIFFMFSDNQGESWSNPLIVNDDNSAFPCDQFHPWISVDDSGRVWIAFYDRRNDPNNLLMDLYFTVSEDGGGQWRDNERITEVSSNPSTGSLDAGLIGEYIGWCARNGEALAVWTDTRLGNQDTYAAVVDSIFLPNSAPQNPAPPLPDQFSISAFPNPFNGQLSIRYEIEAESDLSLHIYNTLGQRVYTEGLGRQTAGAHTTSLDLSNSPSGLYVAELSSPASRSRAKILLLK